MFNDTHMNAVWNLYEQIAAFLAQLGVTLGFEAEGGGCAGGILGAAFRCEAEFAKTGGYVNGTEVRSGGFTVAVRTRDHDTASRREAQRLSLRLLSWIRAEKDRLSAGEDDVLLRGIAPAAAPTRLRLTPDGAVWETRFVYSMVLRSGPSGAPDDAERS